MIEPSLDSTRFTCPACQVIAEQAWFSCYADPIHNLAGVPLRIRGEGLESLGRNPGFPPEVREAKVEYWNRVNRGDVFLERWAPVHSDVFVAGMELSVCHACRQAAIWLGGEMVYPRRDGGG